MAFETYQCERYKIYIKETEKYYESIYDLFYKAPFTYTQLGKVLGYNYDAFSRRLRLQRLTNDEIIKLLDFIK